MKRLLVLCLSAVVAALVSMRAAANDVPPMPPSKPPPQCGDKAVRWGVVVRAGQTTGETVIINSGQPESIYFCTSALVTDGTELVYQSRLGDPEQRQQLASPPCFLFGAAKAKVVVTLPRTYPSDFNFVSGWWCRY